MYNSIIFDNSGYNITFTDIQYEISIINPFIELKRYKLMQEIKEKIMNIFQIHSLDIDVNNIIPRFIMVQYKNKSYYIDPILPYNATDNTQLKKDLYFLSKKKLKNNEIDNLIQEMDLKTLFNNAIEDLKVYINFHKENLTSLEYELNIEKKEDFMYISFRTDDKKEYYHEEVMINNFKIHEKLYNKLLDNYIYKKNDNNFKKLLLCLLLRYNTLESYNQQLSINPDFKNSIKNKYKINFELFASSINCEFNNYCSLFYDIEKNFNSKGNFNLVTLKKGFFISNPPFDEEIMKNMSLKFIECLNDKKSDELSILITIPYWIDDYYNNYEPYSLLKNSGLITYEKIIEKRDSIFYDYYKNTYMTPCKIFLIVIQNKKGEVKHKIDNEFKGFVNKYFSKKYLNNLRKGGRNDNYNSNENTLLLELKNNRDIKIDVNVKIKDYPPDYRLKIAKKFYLERAKFYFNDIYKFESRKRNMDIKTNKLVFKKIIPIPLIDYTEYILRYLIKDSDIKNISLIDLSYDCNGFDYIKYRSKVYHNTVLEYLLTNKSFISTKFNFMYNPLFDSCKKNDISQIVKNINYDKIFNNLKNNQNFVIISGSIEYYNTKSIYYYLEQCQNLYIFIQIYYLINILEKGGDFMMSCWTLSTDICKDYILLLTKYFDKIFLVKKIDVSGNISYLVGKGFKLLSDADKNKFNKVHNELNEYITKTLYGDRINIFNKKTRKEKYVFKPMRREDCGNFIHKLFNLDIDKKYKKNLIKKVNDFHRELFEKTMK